MRLDLALEVGDGAGLYLFEDEGSSDDDGPTYPLLMGDAPSDVEARELAQLILERGQLPEAYTVESGRVTLHDEQGAVLGTSLGHTSNAELDDAYEAIRLRLHELRDCVVPGLGGEVDGVDAP